MTIEEEAHSYPDRALTCAKWLLVRLRRAGWF